MIPLSADHYHLLLESCRVESLRARFCDPECPVVPFTLLAQILERAKVGQLSIESGRVVLNYQGNERTVKRK